MESLEGLTQEDYDRLKNELFELQLKEKIFKENHNKRIMELIEILEVE